MSTDIFIEMECAQFTKSGQAACGDAVDMLSLERENRSLAVLSDGLGSGVKANMLATMTTTMGLRFLRNSVEILPAVETIMDALPVCDVRKISYATFSMVDIRTGGKSRIIEMGNPPYIHMRGDREMPPRSEKKIVSGRWPDREVRCAEFRMEPGDRIVVCSDGVTQAGIGRAPHKFGWRREGELEFVREMIRRDARISARELSSLVAFEALTRMPDNRCIDDISCLVVYMRKPRILRILTGPPYHREHDAEFARQANLGEDHTIVCGGTTANILKRILGKEVELDKKLATRCGNLPPPGMMQNTALVTEGILTVSRVCTAFENQEPQTALPLAARMIYERIMDHDQIEFIVGTRVNEAHQDPSLPQDLELRRGIVRRLAAVLEARYRKVASIQFY